MNAIDWRVLVGLPLLLFFAFLTVRPSIRRSKAIRTRQRLIVQIEAKRGSRVIEMIERQKIGSLFRPRQPRPLDIEDAVEVLRRIRHTLPNVPIDLIVHTTGGLGLAAEPIAKALVNHKAPVTLIVPYYAMAGGTRLALAADKILMSRGAVLGPETCPPGTRPPIGILESLAEVLGAGCWTRTAPINFDIARELGMTVSDELPCEAYQLVDLYPQAAYQPVPAHPIALPTPAEDAQIPKPEQAWLWDGNKPGPTG